ncbi:MAG: TolC family protein [Muribaculaceae bacterium]|nr:TolC family protein [Muribaculaceae bacterium]
MKNILNHLRHTPVPGRLSSRIACGVVMAISLASPSHIIAQNISETPSPERISDVLDIISRNNPSLKVISAENEAEILALKASNIPGKTSVEYSPFFQSGYHGLASSELIVRQSIDFPTLYSTRNKMADAQRSVLEGKLNVEARQIRIEAIKACIDYIGLKKQNEILQRRIAVTDTIADLYQRKFNRGSATLLETNRISLSLQDLKRELLQNSIAASEAEATLLNLNGGNSIDISRLDYDPSLLANTLFDSIAVPNSSVTANPLSDDAASYIAARPEIKAAQAAIQYSDREIDMARSSWLPEISLGYRRNTDGRESLNGFLVGLDFSLFSGSKESKAARARKAAAMMLRETETVRVETEIATTLRRLKVLREAIDATDTSLIEETLSLYNRSLELGQITLPEYYQETDLLFNRLSERAALINSYYNLASSLSL